MIFFNNVGGLLVGSGDNGLDFLVNVGGNVFGIFGMFVLIFVVKVTIVFFF